MKLKDIFLIKFKLDNQRLLELEKYFIMVSIEQVARLEEENRELKTQVQALKDSEGGIPLDLSREFEQRVKRLEAELEVAEDQRRKAAQEVIKLQSQLSESQHAARGHKEVLVSEVSSNFRNIAVKRWAYARGSILAGRARSKFLRKT